MSYPLLIFVYECMITKRYIYTVRKYMYDSLQVCLLLYCWFWDRRERKLNILDKMIHVYLFLNILFGIRITIYNIEINFFFTFTLFWFWGTYNVISNKKQKRSISHKMSKPLHPWLPTIQNRYNPYTHPYITH